MRALRAHIKTFMNHITARINSIDKMDRVTTATTVSQVIIRRIRRSCLFIFASESTI